ncbi:hypothetical protein H4R34_000271 [Dimargaris verticillata]|uniref:Uncharacterized protein n=1 Tax=Dimargaris verticillata TaxID=2761393 RepID=A0A9W8BC52_9FUNG|nr:hypothetical protein H4R34_000271 [Dimargaris verticillata]
MSFIKCGLDVDAVFVENCLKAHHKLQDIVVIGVPDVELDNKVCGCVILKSTYADFTRGDAYPLYPSSLPPYQHLDLVYTFAKFPMGPDGLPDRDALREQR